MGNVGKVKAGSGSKKRVNLRAARLYLVRDTKTWYTMPEPLRKIIIKRVTDAYTFKGKSVMKVERVDEYALPKALNFADAVVRLYQNPTEGHKRIWESYKKQEAQIKKGHPGFNGRNWTYPSADSGNAMVDKRVLAEGKRQYLVCLSEGAVYLSFIKSLAGGVLTRKDNIDYTKPLSELPVEAQEKVARGVGNALAHEARHQLVESPEHADAGIGADTTNANFYDVLFGADSTFSVSDQASIKSGIKSLRLKQCGLETISIDR